MKVLGLFVSNAEELDITGMSALSLFVRIIRVCMRRSTIQILRSREELLHHLRLIKSLKVKKMNMGIG